MNQEQLAKAIEEGMNNHTNWLGWQIVKAFLIGCSLALFMVFFAWIYFDSHPQQQANIGTSVDKCNYPYLSCEIKDLSYFEGGDIDCSINITDTKGNVVCSTTARYNPNLAYNFRICGWQEANAWFENYKESHKTELNLTMSCI